MRLSKYISQSGFTSRREAEKLIKDGKVTINGIKVPNLIIVNEGDEVCVNGKPIKKADKKIYIALNKPVGITCTTEKKVEGNIIDFINHKERIFPIGRLDKDSEGLILLTNDGGIVNKILWSQNNHEKEYVVTVDKKVSSAFLKHMAKGVRVLGVMTKPCKAWQIRENVFGIILTQGMNRQIRRMCSSLGFEVKKLKRIRIMNIELGDLKIGEWRDLTERELKELFRLI